MSPAATAFLPIFRVRVERRYTLSHVCSEPGARPDLCLVGGEVFFDAAGKAEVQQPLSAGVYRPRGDQHHWGFASEANAVFESHGLSEAEVRSDLIRQAEPSFWDFCRCTVCGVRRERAEEPVCDGCAPYLSGEERAVVLGERDFAEPLRLLAFLLDSTDTELRTAHRAWPQLVEAIWRVRDGRAFKRARQARADDDEREVAIRREDLARNAARREVRA